MPLPRSLGMHIFDVKKMTDPFGRPGSARLAFYVAEKEQRWKSSLTNPKVHLHGDHFCFWIRNQNSKDCPKMIDLLTVHPQYVVHWPNNWQQPTDTDKNCDLLQLQHAQFGPAMKQNHGFWVVQTTTILLYARAERSSACHTLACVPKNEQKMNKKMKETKEENGKWKQKEIGAACQIPRSSSSNNRNDRPHQPCQ